MGYPFVDETVLIPRQDTEIAGGRSAQGRKPGMRFWICAPDPAVSFISLMKMCGGFRGTGSDIPKSAGSRREECLQAGSQCNIY